MADEIISRDQNFVTVLAGITDDANEEIRMFRIDPATGRLLVTATGGAGTGTVTDVSVVTANGFAGTVANSTSTPAITLTTTVTGIVKGNGTAISAATAGTDYSDSSFKTISIAGQSDVVADSPADTLTLVAGSGITLTTNASTDTITITSSGGGGSPGGSDTQIQFNDSGSFGGDSGLTWDKTANTLAVTSSGTHIKLLNGTENAEIALDSSYNLVFGHDYVASDNVAQYQFKYYYPTGYKDKGLSLIDTGNGFTTVLSQTASGALYWVAGDGSQGTLTIGAITSPYDGSQLIFSPGKLTYDVGDINLSNGQFKAIKTTEQQRLGYDASNYFSTTVNSTGSATFDLVGTTPEFTFSDPVNVPDEAYGAGWNGSTEVPTKNAIYDAGFHTGTLAISSGGTGQTSQTSAFDALAPTTTQGDTIYHNGTDNVRLAKGTAGQVLTMNAGATAPEWSTPSSGGGGWETISKVQLGASSTTLINVSGLSNYLFFRLTWHVVMATMTQPHLRLNGDTSTNYNYTYIKNPNTTVSGSNQTLSTRIDLATANTNTNGVVFGITSFGKPLTSLRAGGTTESSSISSSSGSSVLNDIINFSWDNTSSLITQIELYAPDSPGFGAGSFAILEGAKAS